MAGAVGSECHTVWLVIFARDLLSRYSRVQSHLQKLKLQNFVVPVPLNEPRFYPAYFKLSNHPNSNRSLSGSVS